MILYLSAVMFIIPIQLFCRYMGAKLTDTIFFVTTSDYLDLFSVMMVAWVWIKVTEYEN